MVYKFLWQETHAQSIFADINETKILAAANQFMSLGLKAVGYQYINIDVCSFVSYSTLLGTYIYDYRTAGH